MTFGITSLYRSTRDLVKFANVSDDEWKNICDKIMERLEDTSSPLDHSLSFIDYTIEELLVAKEFKLGEDQWPVKMTLIHNYDPHIKFKVYAKIDHGPYGYYVEELDILDANDLDGQAWSGYGAG